MKHEEFSSITRALISKAQIEGALPVATPLFQSSAFQTGSPHFYTRKSNPNSEEFETVVKTLEGAEHAVSVTTGMSAIALALHFLNAGDALVINKDIYGCSFKFFQRVSKKRNIELCVLDLSEPKNFSQIPKNTKMVLFETPTNPFLKTINISAVSKYVKNINFQALVVVDNTWATPLYQAPLKCGADISLHSATKYFSGQSDVMGGIILTNNTALYEELKQERFFTGAILDPHSAWLLCRSLQTLPLRLREHERVTREMTLFLREQTQVAKVYYPKVDGQQLTGYGSIVFFEFRKDLKNEYPNFIKHLSLFTTGTGMAAVTSMVAQPYTGSHASMSTEEKLAMGLSEGLVRLCFGLESPEDLKKDLLYAFQAIDLRSKISERELFQNSAHSIT